MVSNISISFDSIFNKIKSNKTFVIFTLLKYVEYLINAYLFFSIARLVSPQVYGQASQSFLLITYSSFIVLGVNQVVVKWYSKTNYTSIRFFLIRYTLFYNAFFAIILFLFIFFLSNSNYIFPVSLICSLRLLVECIITIMRVKKLPVFINAIYIFISISFLSLYYLIVKDMQSFFSAWAYSIAAGVVFSIILFYFFGRERSKMSYKKTLKLFFLYNNNLFLDGFKLTVISIISTIILSIDRVFFINLYNLPEFELGNLQLADNISNLISLGLGSILFIITPIVISNIFSKKIQPKLFYKFGYIIMFIIILILCVLYFPMIWLIKYFFPSYSLVEYPFLIYIILKIMNIGLFIPSILSMVYSKESNYIRIAFFWILILLFLFFTLKYFITIYAAFFVLPLCILLMLFFLHIHLGFFFFKKILI